MIFDEDTDPKTKRAKPRLLDTMSVPDMKEYLIHLADEIKRVEAGQSAFQLPHVNLFLTPGSTAAGKDGLIVFYTGTPASGGILTPVKPATNITPEVINAIIEACRMARINK